LPERQRLVVFLRCYADLEYRQIAEVVGIETGTVSATFSAAHAALRKTTAELTTRAASQGGDYTNGSKKLSP
jgi:DNA-directed RNA polymerase specialized sigma24 family protein